MIANRRARPEGRRTGFSLIELAVTGALIAVALTVTVQVVGWVALERKAVERRERALLEANNLMERIVARPYDDLTTERLGALQVSEATARFLRKPTLEVQVSPAEGAPTRKKIRLEIRWPDRSGRLEAPVRLVAWSYPKGASAR